MMPKPVILTKENIIKDCLAASNSFLHDPVGYRCGNVILWTLVAFLFFLGRVYWLAWINIAFIVYHLVWLFWYVVRYVLQCKRIRNGEFTVSTDVLRYINTETVFEPHLSGSHSYTTREITKLYFTSLSHRLAYTSYYSWCSEYVFTPQGLLNTSKEGDEFYLVSDNKTHDVLCVYNRRFFDGEALIKQ